MTAAGLAAGSPLRLGSVSFDVMTSFNLFTSNHFLIFRNHKSLQAYFYFVFALSSPGINKVSIDVLIGNWDLFHWFCSFQLFLGNLYTNAHTHPPQTCYTYSTYISMYVY